MLKIKMPHAETAAPNPRRRRPKRHPVQLELSGCGRHGGWRRGAGRPRGRAKHYVPHITRPRVTRHHAVHVTLHLVAGIPSIRRHRSRRIIERIFAAESRKGFRLVQYAIRRDHLHLVCEGDHSQAVSRGIQRIASRIARRLNQLFARRGRFFDDRFHGHVIKSPKAMRHVLSYVLLNAHKDEAKRGATLRGVDPYSSWQHFDGWHEPQYRHHARQRARSRDAPVTAAKSWLLRRGWRRHGLIRLDEKATAPTPRRS